MSIAVRVLPGLPPNGPLPSAFPPEWGHLAREGVVVEFASGTNTWVANIRPGLGGVQFAGLLPNQSKAVVIAAGDVWIVDPATRTADYTLPAAERMWAVHNPEGWVLSRQGLAFARLGPEGLLWHTRRISWDGFDEIALVQNELRGRAWSPGGWTAFAVDLETGHSSGGSYAEDDFEGWQVLADQPGARRS